MLSNGPKITPEITGQKPDTACYPMVPKSHQKSPARSRILPAIQWSQNRTRNHRPEAGYCLPSNGPKIAPEITGQKPDTACHPKAKIPKVPKRSQKRSHFERPNRRFSGGAPLGGEAEAAEGLSSLGPPTPSGGGLIEQFLKP